MSPLSPTLAGYDEARDRLARSVVVITSGTADTAPWAHAMTADSFVTISDNPPLVLVALRSHSRMQRVVNINGCFAISVLGGHQQDHARWFASRDRGDGLVQFAPFRCRDATQVSALLVDDAAAWFECSLYHVSLIGDHVAMIGEVLDAQAGTTIRPLLRQQLRYSQVTD